MAYTKQNWVTGDTITAEKLNHMEDGIAGEYDIVFRETHTTGNNPVLTGHGISLEEIKEKVEAGIPIHGLYTCCDEDRYTVNDLGETMSVVGDGYCCLYFYAGSSSNRVITIYSAEIESPIGGVYTYTYDSTTKDYTFTFDHWLE